MALACVIAGCLAAPAGATPAFSALPGALSTERYEPVVAALPSGRVLVAGGALGTETLKSTELIDLATGKVEKLEGAGHELVEPRQDAATVILPGGKVLIAGGYNSASKDLASAEIFDPTTNTFEKLSAALTEPRDGPGGVLLANGKVLIAGGHREVGNVDLATAETFDPTTRSFQTVTGSMTTGRYEPGIGLLPGGKVLVAGGFTTTPLEGSLKSAEVFDPNTSTFTKLPAEMVVARAKLAAASLPDGEILLAGGFNAAEKSLNSAEFFNPLTGSFEAIASKMTAKRDGPAAAVLPSGGVFIAGGAREGAAPTVTSFEQLVFPPVASNALGVSQLTQSSARLNGSALGEVPSTVHFQYGTTAAYGAVTASQPLGPAINPQATVAQLNGLAAATTYHFRLVAENVFGTSVSADGVFTTPPTAKKPPPPPPHSVPPVLSAVGQSHAVWREAHRHPRHRNVPVGTTFTFSLNERATVRLTFTQLLPGRRVGHSCVAPSRRNRHRHACIRRRVRGSLVVSGRVHRNSVPFKGVLPSGASLPPGSYTVQIVATNAKGERSATVRLSFRIVT